MFNVGGGELLVILLIALIVLGPDKLPEAARKIGKVLTELRRMSQGFQDEVRSAMDLTSTDTPSQTSPGPRLVGPIDTSPEADDATGEANGSSAA